MILHPIHCNFASNLENKIKSDFGTLKKVLKHFLDDLQQRFSSNYSSALYKHFKSPFISLKVNLNIEMIELQILKMTFLCLKPEKLFDPKFQHSVLKTRNFINRDFKF